MKRFTLAVITGALALNTVFATQANDLKPVIKAGKEISNLAVNSQQKINGIAEQTQTKFQQYQMVNKEIEGLNTYNAQLQKQLQSQYDEMKSLNADIDRVSVIERQITPLMIRMIDGLQKFVELDVPFLPTERAERISSLKNMMDRADVAVSEKFRRVLEAYQVEMGYGRSIEAYSGLINVEGQERDVDFLRIGRVALMYITRDGSVAGVWDNEAKNWQPAEDEFRMHITKGLRMAKKQLAPDLLVMPIKAAP